MRGILGNFPPWRNGNDWPGVSGQLFFRARNLFMFAQIMIAVFGVTAVWLTQQSNQDLKRYACFFGLLGQPFWVYATYSTEQWGMFILTLCYTYAWYIGLWNTWVAPKK